MVTKDFKSVNQVSFKIGKKQVKHIKQPMTEEQLLELIDNTFLNVGPTVPGGVFSDVGQELIIRSLTQFVVSICAAWWSVQEIMDYIKNRQSYKEKLYERQS